MNAFFDNSLKLYPADLHSWHSILCFNGLPGIWWGSQLSRLYSALVLFVHLSNSDSSKERQIHFPVHLLPKIGMKTN
jgi:hypothetical protein